MGDPKGFLTIERAQPLRQPVDQRVRHWGEFYHPMPDPDIKAQGARCMDCGVPFCQGDTGCPLHNLIPEWNDLVHRGRWQEALDALHATNNFPEFTGRLCPAPCESACVLGIVAAPVTIKSIEQAIVDRGFAEGWIVPRPARVESGFSVAVVGSGPAGLAAAQQLCRMGHAVTVFERSDRPGGLLRYGIPEFKMEKAVLDRRLDQMRAEGVRFRTSVDVGADISVAELGEEFDAICLAGGADAARDLTVPGRELGGIHQAMEFLTQQNRRLAGDEIDGSLTIDAAGKRVVVIGGGDTGSDCVGTCRRQGASIVHQLELLPRPPLERSANTPWPHWPLQLRTSHAHEEGCERDWTVSTTAFTGDGGRVSKLHAVRVEQQRCADGGLRFGAVAGSEFTIDADLVLLAMGFTGPAPSTLLTDLGVAIDNRGNVATGRDHRTSVDGVFAAGDVRRGASLIVWAIREGRDAATSIDAYLGARREAPAYAASG
jgi:glutamate synthase (NADPH/NADH) small chain